MSLLIKIISVLGIIVALSHMILYAIYQYNATYFFIGLGIVYLFVPLVKYLNKLSSL